MTRRGLSRILVSLALVVASLAWTGLTLQRTVFDATRSERVIAALLDNQAVREALKRQLVGTADAALPEEVRGQITTEELNGAVATALDDPRVRTAVEHALVDSHRYVIGEMDEPPLLDTTVIDGVLRERLAAVNPSVAAALPRIEPIRIALPSAGLSPIAKARQLILDLTPLLALTAACAALAGLAISPNKPGVLRRIGFWAVSLGAVWIVLRFALPALAEKLLGDSGVILAALAKALADGMGGPGVVLFGVGLALLGVASLVASMQRSLSATERRAQQGRNGARDQARQARQARRAQADEARQLKTAARAASRPARPSAPQGHHQGRAADVAQPTGGQTAGERSYTGNGSAPSTEDPGTYRPPTTGGSPTSMVAMTGPHPGAPTPSHPPVGSMRGATALPVPPTVPSPPGQSRTLPLAVGVAETGVLGVNPAGVNPPMAIPLTRRQRTQPATAPEPAGPLATFLATSLASPMDTDGTPSERAHQAGAPTQREAASVIKAQAPNEWLGGFPMHPGSHQPIAGPAPAPPRWVEGVGYVYEKPPTPAARWIDGLGYVLDSD